MDHSITKQMEVFVLRKFAFLAVLLLLSQAHANHYGMAGCGLGSLVFGDQPGKIQIVASTVNNLVSPQTSAITSGTSGCYEEGSASASLNYIEINQVSLKEDAARGSGETLNGLSTLLGCHESSSFNAEIKANYNSIFGQSNAKGIYNAIKANPSVQKTCNILG
jgi:hypothetical protein